METDVFLLIKSNANLKRRLKNSRTILRDVLSRVNKIDEEYDGGKEECLQLLLRLKKILNTYEDDYTVFKGKNNVDVLYFDRDFPIESDLYAEQLVARIGGDYRKYKKCLEFNKSSYRDCFKGYGMSKSVFADVKRDLKFLDELTKGDIQLRKYLKCVCLDGMSTEDFVQNVLKKKSKSLATYLKKKLIDKIIEAKDIHEQITGTMVKEVESQELVKKNSKIEDELNARIMNELTSEGYDDVYKSQLELRIEAELLDVDDGDVTRFEDIEERVRAEMHDEGMSDFEIDESEFDKRMRQAWEEIEESEVITNEEMNRNFVLQKRKKGKPIYAIRENGKRYQIDTKTNDIRKDRDDYIGINNVVYSFEQK